MVIFMSRPVSTAELQSSIDVEFLARAYDKPVEFVQRCLKFHGITSLPGLRTPDDGLSAFYSDMTSMYFDPDFQDGVDSNGKPNYPSRSRTMPEFTDELDLNVIMARYKMSNFDPSTLPVATRQALTGDFSNAPESYHAALSYITDTKRAFMSLDAELRAKFHNDPQEFLDFVADPKNAEEIISLGLADAVKEDLSTTISRSFKDLGEMVVGKSGDAPDPSPAPLKKASTRREAD